jgi:erythritol kinase
MTRDLIIGIDAGTSVIKAVAFGLGGRQAGIAAVANGWQALPDGGAEQDMAATWARAAETLRLLAGQIPDLAGRVAALAITGQGDGTWLVDHAGEPAAPAWLWLDARANTIVTELRATDADRQRFAITGTGIAACHQGPQLAWMQRHRPGLLDRAAHALHCKDWLYFCLTGVVATDPSEGTLSYGDFRRRAYDDAVLDQLGIAALRRLLPAMVDGTREQHPLSAAAAAATGLQTGTPVVLGSIDIVCTAIGGGLLDHRAEVGCSIIGSTGMHMRLVRSAEAVQLNDARTGYVLPLPLPGAYAPTQSNMAATLNIDWLVDLVAGILAVERIERPRRDLLVRLEALAATAAPGQLIYHPYISEAGERGPFLDGAARAGFCGLSSRHGIAELVRAVYEGLGFAARDCYAGTGRTMPAEVRLCGGAARSPVLRGILAATLDTPVRTSRREEAGAAGAAMIAAVGIGLYPDVEACAEEWVAPLLDEVLAPDPDLATRYRTLAPAWRAARLAMQPVWHALAR